MSRQELEGLLKVTNRAIEILVAWIKIYRDSKCPGKDDERIESVNSWIVEMTEYKLELKNILKGNGEWALSDKLRFLLKEIEETKDPDSKKLYTERLVKLTKGFLNDGLLEVMDGKQ